MSLTRNSLGWLLSALVASPGAALAQSGMTDQQFAAQQMAGLRQALNDPTTNMRVLSIWSDLVSYSGQRYPVLPAETGGLGKALPNGTILLDVSVTANPRDVVAFWLAHEYGHQVLRHPLLTLMRSGAFMDAAGGTGQEDSADRWAGRFLRAKGYDIRPVLEFLCRLPLGGPGDTHSAGPKRASIVSQAFGAAPSSCGGAGLAVADDVTPTSNSSPIVTPQTVTPAIATEIKENDSLLKASLLRGDQRQLAPDADSVKVFGMIAKLLEGTHIETGKTYRFRKTPAGGSQLVVESLTAGDYTYNGPFNARVGDQVLYMHFPTSVRGWRKTSSEAQLRQWSVAVPMNVSVYNYGVASSCTQVITLPGVLTVWWSDGAGSGVSLESGIMPSRATGLGDDCRLGPALSAQSINMGFEMSKP